MALAIFLKRAALNTLNEKAASFCDLARGVVIQQMSYLQPSKPAGTERPPGHQPDRGGEGSLPARMRQQPVADLSFAGLIANPRKP